MRCLKSRFGGVNVQFVCRMLSAGVPLFGTRIIGLDGWWSNSHQVSHDETFMVQASPREMVSMRASLMTRNAECRKEYRVQDHRCHKPE
jgi:hypothetical protein